MCKDEKLCDFNKIVDADWQGVMEQQVTKKSDMVNT
jgi:hypothetical protein